MTQQEWRDGVVAMAALVGSYVFVWEHFVVPAIVCFVISAVFASMLPRRLP